ncbi:MAG: 2-isopropylmalate synthase [Gammaproteobacteria bacterium]|nr:2-isopropylmalate synthase [Gammaproteobacteria bacterium]
MSPATRYRAFPPIDLPGRRWPARVITSPPAWLSTDLRDGNQALFEPMGAERKLRMFRMLCDIGFREIEVGFPSASKTEFDFVRTLIEGGHIPEDVTIGVLTQAREPLIRRTIEALRGARRAIVHVYTATSPVFREFVFGMQRADVVDMTVSGVRLIRELCSGQPGTEWVLEYSPETFSATELEFSREICDAVVDAWGATPQRKVILNLPATVEVATPNVYADQVEWMDRHLARRDSVIISVHPHNDRGTAVAAAELALMAGAERVEGCLFGNGERTGNVDLVTLALNLRTQGVDPGLRFADINAIARTYEACTQLPIHPRHPYVGDLVFTAFSGSHQDAIRKGMAAQRPADCWNVPYLPIDPADLGRTYDSLVRVNSQSGKGGVAYLLEMSRGVVMPRRMQVEFSGAVQRLAETTGSEVTAEDIWRLFTAEYLERTEPVHYIEHHLFERGARQGVRLTVVVGGTQRVLEGTGNGPIDAVIAALGIPVEVQSYEERSLNQGADSRALAIVEMALQGVTGSTFGAGIDANIVTASVRALMAGLNRMLARVGAEERRHFLAALAVPGPAAERVA